MVPIYRLEKDGKFIANYATAKAAWEQINKENGKTARIFTIFSAYQVRRRANEKISSWGPTDEVRFRPMGQSVILAVVGPLEVPIEVWLV